VSNAAPQILQRRQQLRRGRNQVSVSRIAIPHLAND
jgi:hypothetical protein